MKRVTMFVWNHFTNDARVMRESMTLSENGYDLNLIAIEDKRDTQASKLQKINDHFRVYRVRMYPRFLELYQSNKAAFIIGLAGMTMVIVPALFFKSWLILSTYFLVLAAGILSLKNSRIRQNLIKLVRSCRMVYRGYRQNADIYHSHDLNTLTQGVICSKLRLKPKKLIYDSHEVQTDRTGYNKRFVRWWERSLLKFVDVTIVENETRAAHHENLYGYYPKTLYNYSVFYDVDKRATLELKKTLGVAEDEKLLLYQGGLQAGRGLENLIKMMHLVDEGTLVFIGDGRLKQILMRQVIEENLSDKVKFFPKVHMDILPSYTKEAYIGFQVLQNTSYNHYSAASNKLFEYIMAHIPIVSCDFPEIKNIVEREKVGISLDASNIEQLAKVVNMLVKDEALRNRYSENCRSAKMNYNWDNEQQKLLEIYNNLDVLISKEGH